MKHGHYCHHQRKQKKREERIKAASGLLKDFPNRYNGARQQKAMYPHRKTVSVSSTPLIQH